MKLSVLFAVTLVHFAAAAYVPRAAPGTQFITGPCSGDIDCASGCCGFKSGKCAGAIVAQERDGGCGFGDAQPNDNAARKLRGEAPASSTAAPAATTTAPAAASTAAAAAPTSAAPSVAPGSQFITGPCTSDADCASGCCGFKSGKCAGAIVAQERDGGCGFGDAQPNDNAARKLRGEDPASSAPASVAASVTSAAASAVSTASAAAPTSAAPSVAPGSQFITGPCTSDADCASGCCGFKSGKCAGAIVAQERDGGCGFGDSQPNDNAARKLRGEAPASSTAAPAATTTAPAAASTAAAAAPTSAAPSVAPGSQFITGPCTSDADCASGCCGFKSGKCAGAIVAQERDGGCGFGDAQPNDNAAQKLRQ